MDELPVRLSRRIRKLSERGRVEEVVETMTDRPRVSCEEGELRFGSSTH